MFFPFVHTSLHDSSSDLASKPSQTNFGNYQKHVWTLSTWTEEKRQYTGILVEHSDSVWFSDDCAERDQNLILFHSRSISNHKMQWRFFHWSRKTKRSGQVLSWNLTKFYPEASTWDEKSIFMVKIYERKKCCDYKKTPPTTALELCAKYSTTTWRPFIVAAKHCSRWGKIRCYTKQLVRSNENTVGESKIKWQVIFI